MDSDSIKTEEYKPGEVVMRQDDQGYCMYLCEEGEVSFIADRKDVGSCVPGGSFCELLLFYGSPRVATCVAFSNCLLWKVDRVASKFQANVMTVVNFLRKAYTDTEERIVLGKETKKGWRNHTETRRCLKFPILLRGR